MQIISVPRKPGTCFLCPVAVEHLHGVGGGCHQLAALPALNYGTQDGASESCENEVPIQ